MNKLKEYKYIIIIALLIICGAFYWFQYRPSQIRKICAVKTLLALSVEERNEARKVFEKNDCKPKEDGKWRSTTCGLSEAKMNRVENVKVITSDVEYKQCLRRKGL